MMQPVWPWPRPVCAQPSSFPFVIQPVDLARPVAAVDVLGSDLDAPRRAHAADGFLEVQIGVIDLDAEVAAVGDINVALRVRGDAVRRVELIVAGTVRSHRSSPKCRPSRS